MRRTTTRPPSNPSSTRVSDPYSPRVGRAPAPRETGRAGVQHWFETGYKPVMTSFGEAVAYIADLRKRSNSSMEARYALSEACTRFSQQLVAARRAIGPSGSQEVDDALGAMLNAYGRAAQNCVAGRFFELDVALTEGAESRSNLKAALAGYGLRP
jgi:hypothetical protein